MSKNKQPSVPLVRSGQEFSNVDKEKKPKVHNNLLEEYFRRPDIFADFVNGVSEGKLNITPEMLSSVDTTLVVSDLSTEDGVKTIITKELFRDVAKKVTEKDGSQYQISIEDQSTYDENMGLRVLLYDSLGLNSLKHSEFIPNVTIVCNWDKKTYNNQIDISELFKAPYPEFIKAHMIKLILLVFDVINYIQNKDKYIFKTELETVFTFISCALNDMGMDKIEATFPGIKDKKMSKEAFMIVNLYIGLDINYNELSKEGNNVMTIYQEAIIRAAEKAAEEAAEKAAEKAAEQTKTENTFELALTLSKKYNRSFESILDDFEVDPEERTKCMEKYRNNVG